MYLLKKMKAVVPLFVFLLFFSPYFLFPENLYAATVQVSVVQSMDHYPAGGSFPLEIQITTAKGWYIHGAERGENFLIPTVLSFPATGEVRIKKIEFPAPEQITFAYAKDPIEVFSGENPRKGSPRGGKRGPAGKAPAEGRAVLSGLL